MVLLLSEDAEKLRHIEFVYSFIFICVNNNRGIVYMRPQRRSHALTLYSLKFLMAEIIRTKLSYSMQTLTHARTHTHAMKEAARMRLNGPENVKENVLFGQRTIKCGGIAVGCDVVVGSRERRDVCSQKSQNIQMTNEMWMGA